MNLALLLSVGIGGFIGAILRFSISTGKQQVQLFLGGHFLLMFWEVF